MYRNLNMATNILNCKHRSPRILLTPLRLPSVSSLHLPGVSGKKLFTTTKVSLSPLHFGSPNSKPQSVSNLGRTAKSFRLANRINRRFSKISMCNARRCLTCHHISCKSTITSSINGNRYGIQIDKDVDWNSSNLIYVITWEARGCGAQYVGETSQSLKGRFRSHSLKIRNNSRRKFKNFLYDHFIKYNHSIENVTITPVEILSKQPGDSKNDMKKRRLSAELNWIKRLQTPCPLGLNDQIYQQGNISSVRSNINVFSLKPDVRRKRRSHGVCRNGLSRRKKDWIDPWMIFCESRKITVDMSFYMHSLLFQCLDWNQSWMRLTAEV